MAGRQRKKKMAGLPTVVDPADGLPVVDGGDLPILTPAQFEFVGLIAGGMPRLHAYRKAYPDAKVGDNWVHAQAARLCKRDEIKQWLSALNEARLVTYLGSANQYVAECRGLMEEAKKSGNFNAVIRAQELIGKAEGHFERSFVSVEQKEDGDLVKRAEIAMGPNAAQWVRDQLGISDE